MAKRFVTKKEMIAINDLLRQHVMVNEVDGTCTYKDDWDDDKIAKAVSQDLVAHHVYAMRGEVYGKLIKPRSTDKDEDLRRATESIELVNTRLDDLTLRLNGLSDLHSRLCVALALNRVADVKHLAGPTANQNGKTTK